MKKFGKFIAISSLCVTSLACAQNYQYGQYSSDMNHSNQPQPGYSQSYQTYGQSGQHQNTGYPSGNPSGAQQNQSTWSNWFGGNQTQTQNVPDNVISSRIMQNLRSTPYLSDGAHNIQIVTKDGKVTLKGKVANSNEKNQIEYMIKNVEGVKSVSNDLDTAQ